MTRLLKPSTFSPHLKVFLDLAWTSVPGATQRNAQLKADPWKIMSKMALILLLLLFHRNCQIRRYCQVWIVGDGLLFFLFTRRRWYFASDG